MQKTIIIVSLLSIFFFGTALAATPQEPTNTDPCSADMQQFCKDIQPGRGRIAACMKEHSRDLSPACKDHITKLEKNIRLFAKACRSDAQKYCRRIKPGDGRIFFCLKDHEADLADHCRTLLNNR